MINNERNTETLKSIVKKIYNAMLKTEEYICNEFPKLKNTLEKDIFFITSEELLQKYPNMSVKERENAICKEKKAVFIMQIGDLLSNGEKHDGRAPDYDDWALNGDIFVWNELLGMAFELSSMGIRVSEDSLKVQLKKANCEQRATMPFHSALLNGELPYSIGGGIGQSRLCMLMLQKAHIGEVQASVWSDDMLKACKDNGIAIL